MRINRADKMFENPFKCVPVVVWTWLSIACLGIKRSWEIDEGCIQKVESRVVRNIRLVIQKIGEGKVRNRDEVAGSNDEKMSVSIKT